MRGEEERCFHTNDTIIWLPEKERQNAGGVPSSLIASLSGSINEQCIKVKSKREKDKRNCMNKITRDSKFESFQLADHLFREGNLGSTRPFCLHLALKRKKKSNKYIANMRCHPK